jgi:hypothetical protein
MINFAHAILMILAHRREDCYGIVVGENHLVLSPLPLWHIRGLAVQSPTFLPTTTLQSLPV